MSEVDGEGEIVEEDFGGEGVEEEEYTLHRSKYTAGGAWYYGNLTQGWIS